jgi:hypothetical protein
MSNVQIVVSQSLTVAGVALRDASIGKRLGCHRPVELNANRIPSKSQPDLVYCLANCEAGCFGRPGDFRGFWH